MSTKNNPVHPLVQWRRVSGKNGLLYLQSFRYKYCTTECLNAAGHHICQHKKEFIEDKK